MKFDPPLIPARLKCRYKRFLADVTLDDGSEITVHVANPGAMTHLAEPTTQIWLQDSQNPKRKLRYSWRLAQHNDALICVDTSLANQMVKQALTDRTIEAFNEWPNFQAEVKYGAGSRIDFLLSGDGMPDHYVEVKSVTLMRKAGLAEFPDSVTARGTKHLTELADMVRQGHRATMLYLVQHSAADAFQIAADIDPKYAQAFTAARNAGVNMLCLSTSLSPQSMTVINPLPVNFS